MFKKPQEETAGGEVDQDLILGDANLNLQEAISLGTAALECLEKTRAELRAAESVSPSEELGGVFEATKVQLTRIENAGQNARAAQRLLRRFHEGLADPILRAHIAIHIAEFSHFVESFLDVPISDWVVKSKIQAALSTCGTTIAAVSATLVADHRLFVDSFD